MGIGVSVFLIAVGAILAFAVNATVSGLDIAVIGYILMVVGIVGLLTTLLIFAPRRRSATVVQEERVVRDPDVY
ncbi:MAG: DUF6458 family protein [Mycobacteriales bacterium]